MLQRPYVLSVFREPCIYLEFPMLSGRARYRAKLHLAASSGAVFALCIPTGPHLGPLSCRHSKQRHDANPTPNTGAAKDEPGNGADQQTVAAKQSEHGAHRDEDTSELQDHRKVVSERKRSVLRNADHSRKFQPMNVFPLSDLSKLQFDKNQARHASRSWLLQRLCGSLAAAQKRHVR
jgi:hypothetical protein